MEVLKCQGRGNILDFPCVLPITHPHGDCRAGRVTVSVCPAGLLENFHFQVVRLCKGNTQQKHVLGQKPLSENNTSSINYHTQFQAKVAIITKNLIFYLRIFNLTVYSLVVSEITDFSFCIVSAMKIPKRNSYSVYFIIIKGFLFIKILVICKLLSKMYTN